MPHPTAHTVHKKCTTTAVNSTHNINDVQIFLVRALGHQQLLADVVHWAQLLRLQHQSATSQSINQPTNAHNHSPPPTHHSPFYTSSSQEMEETILQLLGPHDTVVSASLRLRSS